MATAIIFDNPQAMRSKRWALTQKPKPKRIQGTELRPLCQWLAASGAIQSCGREHHATRGVSGHRDTEKRAAPNRTPQGERQGRGPTTQRGHPRSLSYEFDQFLSHYKIYQYNVRARSRTMPCRASVASSRCRARFLLRDAGQLCPCRAQLGYTVTSDYTRSPSTLVATRAAQTPPARRPSWTPRPRRRRQGMTYAHRSVDRSKAPIQTRHATTDASPGCSPLRNIQSELRHQMVYLRCRVMSTQSAPLIAKAAHRHAVIARGNLTSHAIQIMSHAQISRHALMYAQEESLSLRPSTRNTRYHLRFFARVDSSKGFALASAASLRLSALPRE